MSPSFTLVEYLINSFRQTSNLRMNRVSKLLWSLNQSFCLLCRFSDVSQVGELFRVNQAFLKVEKKSDSGLKNIKLHLEAHLEKLETKL